MDTSPGSADRKVGEVMNASTVSGIRDTLIDMKYDMRRLRSRRKRHAKIMDAHYAGSHVEGPDREARIAAMYDYQQDRARLNEIGELFLHGRAYLRALGEDPNEHNRF